MPRRLPVHLLDPAGSPDGYAPIVSGGKFILDDPSGGVNLRWFVATTYGAVEGGSTTDNRTALNALIADLNTAGEGVFYLDGSFEVDGVLDAITAKANIFGDGAGDLQAQNAASGLKYNATTGYLLTLDNDAIVLEGFGLENPTTTTQTAGAGIRITQGDNIRWRNVSVRGFYDNVTVEDGALWTMRDCYLVGPVRYSLYIRHIDLPDGGDMVVNGCWFYAEDRNPSAAVRIESGGGLKFGGNKINTLFGTGHYTYGLDASITATTGVLTLSGNSIENTTSSAIRGQNSGGMFQAVAITGNQFGYYSAITAPAVDINGWKDVTVVGNTGLAQFGGSTQPMVKLTSVTNGAVGLNTMEGFTAEYSLVSCTAVTTIPAPFAGITVQDEDANVSTGVTQIDFQGAGVTATAGSGEVVVTIPGAPAVTGELLMQDGITGPPVPVETEARDDWLYQG